MLVAALASFSFAVPTVQAGDVCAYNAAEVLTLTPQQFDQDLASGWRTLANKKCYLEAAKLIRSYRTARLSSLSESQLHLSYWHEGQMRAFAGDPASAVPLLLSGVSPDNSDDFADYALGTVAFLERDLAALKTARNRLASLPAPPDWQSRSKVTLTVNGVKMSGQMQWPPNLNALDGLIACFDRPYATAYTAPCTKTFSLEPVKP